MFYRTHYTTAPLYDICECNIVVYNNQQILDSTKRACKISNLSEKNYHSQFEASLLDHVLTWDRFADTNITILHYNVIKHYYSQHQQLQCG